MLMKNLATGHLIEIEDLTDLTNPFATTAGGRELWGEELQDVEEFSKSELGFPSGEPIPLSWTDPYYQARTHSEQVRSHSETGSQTRPASNLETGASEAEQDGYNGA